MVLKPVESPWRVLSELVHLPGTLCPSHRWMQISSGVSKGNILCACCHGELLELEHGESACLRPLRGRPWHYFHSSVNHDEEEPGNGTNVKRQQYAWNCCQCDTKVAFEVAPPVVSVGIWEALSSGKNAIAVLKMLTLYQLDFIQETPRNINTENPRFLKFMTVEGYLFFIGMRDIPMDSYSHNNAIN